MPASNVASRHIELANIQNWAKRNNLKLNCDKSCEVVFTDSIVIIIIIIDIFKVA